MDSLPWVRAAAIVRLAHIWDDLNPHETRQFHQALREAAFHDQADEIRAVAKYALEMRNADPTAVRTFDEAPGVSADSEAESGRGSSLAAIPRLEERTDTELKAEATNRAAAFDDPWRASCRAL
jgi:hypothetical protein